MSDFPTCISSTNVICKHVRATKTYYADLNDTLPAGVTLVSVTADTEDAGLTVAAVEIITTNTNVDGAGVCDDVTLIADRAIQITLSGGTPQDDDETIVTVNWVDSDGTEDSRELRLILSGTAAI